MDLKSEMGFRPANERFSDEKSLRLAAVKDKMRFGIRYLDKALGAIIPTDLIVVGAATGSGKSELVTNIALTNIQDGKKVYFFALEAEDAEIERRIKYRMIADLYYAEGNTEPISFIDWYYGNIDLSSFEARIESPQLENLFTKYRSGEFRIKNLTAAYNALKGKAQLIILDHIHFVDLEDDGSNTEMKELLKTIKELANVNKIPCIAVSHLRKRTGDKKKDIAELDDFHGSSDITKIATKVVLLQAGKITEDGNSITYIHASKNRHAGERTKVLAALKFNPRTNSYLPEVAIYGVNEGKISEKQVNPYWMRR